MLVDPKAMSSLVFEEELPPPPVELFEGSESADDEAPDRKRWAAAMSSSTVIGVGVVCFVGFSRDPEVIKYFGKLTSAPLSKFAINAIMQQNMSNCMACHAPATLHCPVPFCRAPFCSKRCYKITYKPHAKVTHPAISSSNSTTVKASSHGGLGVFASTAVTKVSERDCDRSEGEAKRGEAKAKRRRSEAKRARL